jgi:hypothetical protein
MYPVSPVIEGFEQHEVVFAKDQPQYKPLPSLPIDDGECIVTRWQLSWKEVLRLLLTRSVYLKVKTFGHPLQPVMLSINPPEVI